MKNFINLIVDQINNGMRVDLFLTKKNPEISRSRIKNLILKKKLKLNNNVLEDPSKKVIAGDKVLDRKSTRLNSSHVRTSRMPSSA